MFANEDIEVAGLTKTHGIDALGNITTTANVLVDEDIEAQGDITAEGSL